MLENVVCWAKIKELATNTFSPSVPVRDKPLTHHGCNSESKKLEATDDNPFQCLLCSTCNEDPATL
jgi:hypothetical protein